MIKATTVLLAGDVDALAYVFEVDSTRWVCLRSPHSGQNRGWLECWSNKEGVSPDMVAALRAIQNIVNSHLKNGPLGPYIQGAHFIPGWNAWGGARPAPLVHVQPNAIAAIADEPITLDEYAQRMNATSGG